MPTLDELKQTWFLSIDQFLDYELNVRDLSSNVSLYTDNNLVTVLGEGAYYVEVWFNLIQRANEVRGSVILHAGWDLNDILCYASDATATAFNTLIQAAKKNPENVFVLLNGGLMPGNLGPVIETLRLGDVFATLDRNFPATGSAHQKFFVQKLSDTNATALLGSCDISEFGQDAGHHELGVMINGPAVRDLELTFRERWESPAFDPALPGLPPSPVTYPDAGGHSIQVLRTYGYKAFGFPPDGEFSIWASYLNAIQKAQRYIYIEDQYFHAFDWRPCFEREPPHEKARDTDLVYQLGCAIERGVKVVVVTNYFDPGEFGAGYGAENYNRLVANYQRQVSIEYLSACTATAGTGSDFIIGRLKFDRDNIHNHYYVHTKLMLVDDEFSIIGSGNFDQRSMTQDDELSIGIVDRENLFTRNLRIRLLREHLNNPNANVEDWDAGFRELKTAIDHGLGNVRPFPLTAEIACFHGEKLTNLVEPYAGPPGLRE